MKIKNKKKVKEFGNLLLNEFSMIHMTQPLVSETWEFFQESNRKMSFTDFSNLAILNSLKIETIATFDKEFKKIKGITLVDS